MALWYIHRNDAGTITSIHQEPMADYATDALDESTPELQAWIAANLKDPVPQAASAGDFMRALYDLGWYDSAKAAVAAVGGLAQILWDHAATFERQHPMVIQIATAIGKTSADLDSLFRKSATYA